MNEAEILDNLKNLNGDEFRRAIFQLAILRGYAKPEDWKVFWDHNMKWSFCFRNGRLRGNRPYPEEVD